MDDTRSGCHPLALQITDYTLVAKAVTVINLTPDKIGDRLYATVRVPREAFYIVTWILRVESVKHQERIKIPDCPVAQDPAQADAGSVHGMLAPDCLG